MGYGNRNNVLIGSDGSKKEPRALREPFPLAGEEQALVVPGSQITPGTRARCCTAQKTTYWGRRTRRSLTGLQLIPVLVQTSPTAAWPRLSTPHLLQEHRSLGQAK